MSNYTLRSGKSYSRAAPVKVVNVTPMRGTKKDVQQDKAIVVLKGKVKKLEHSAELKYEDVYDQSNITSSGVIINLSTLGQGDDGNQRIGEEMTHKFLNYVGRFVAPTSSTANQFRIIFFWDRQFNTGASTVVFTGVGGVNNGDALLDNTTITADLNAPHNYRTKDRYKVLSDQLYVMNPYSSVSTMALNIKKNFKLGGVKVKYANSGGGTASVVSKCLLFLMFGVSGSTPAVHNSFRMWYTDS